MSPFQMQLSREAEVLAEREERVERYTRFFNSDEAQAVASMSKPIKARQKPKLVQMRKTA